MKKIWLVIILGLVTALMAGVWWKGLTGPVTNQPTPVRVTITKGMSAGQIGNKLFQAKAINSSLAFKLYVSCLGQAGKIQAGQYRLLSNKPLSGIVAELLSGPVEVWVTVPEGLRREEIAGKVVAGLGLTGEEAKAFRSEFLGLSQGKEGYLFPETYLFPRDVTASLVVTKMLATFDQKVNLDTGNLERLVILASVIERETKGKEEKPVVAGILVKRLAAGWPLQVDATLQYAAGTKRCDQTTEACDYWLVPASEDRQIVSVFNTYTHQGLPPSPICNPGLASLQAAVSPQASDYWFYLHDTRGQIHYAVTAQDHAVNIQKYLN